MTTERQKAANRANARRSTGPKTPKGKAAVRLNAIRHGLLARDAVLPGEDSDAFEELLEGGLGGALAGRADRETSCGTRDQRDVEASTLNTDGDCAHPFAGVLAEGDVARGADQIPREERFQPISCHHCYH